MGKAIADIIIVADSTKFFLRQMTQRCIESCWISEISRNLNIIVIDQNKKTPGFEKAVTYTYDFPFNYNRCLNLGLRLSHAPYVAMCNNDLLFHKDWLTNIIKAMGTEFYSASPYKQYYRGLSVKEGYRIAKEVLGWCIVAKRPLIDKIGSLDTDCKFWGSDDIYANQIKRAGFKHCLVYGSHVTHLGSKTLFNMPGTSKQFTREQMPILRKYLNKNSCE